MKNKRIAIIVICVILAIVVINLLVPILLINNSKKMLKGLPIEKDFSAYGLYNARYKASDEDWEEIQGYFDESYRSIEKEYLVGTCELYNAALYNSEEELRNVEEAYLKTREIRTLFGKHTYYEFVAKIKQDEGCSVYCHFDFLSSRVK